MKIQSGINLSFNFFFFIPNRLKNDLTIGNINCCLHLVSCQNPDLYTSSRKSLYTRWHTILKFVFYGSTSNQYKILFYKLCHLHQFNTLQASSSFWNHKKGITLQDVLGVIKYSCTHCKPMLLARSDGKI